MSTNRRSRLDVVARLARLNERRELTELGKAQRHARDCRNIVLALETSVATTRTNAALPSGSAASARDLVAHQRRLVALRDREAAGRVELLEAGRVEQEAVQRVIQARARVRGIDQAIEKRRAREARRQRRVQQRRIDELVRGLDALRTDEGAS